MNTDKSKVIPPEYTVVYYSQGKLHSSFLNEPGTKCLIAELGRNVPVVVVKGKVIPHV